MSVADRPASAGEDGILRHFAAHAFSAFDKPKVVGLAVSGGSDSMAMLHLMACAAPMAGWQVRAVTVDHRLRPEAADEARFVAGVCADLGVPHEIISWDHGVIAGNVMDQARRARYGLIADWAKRQGIGHVALAHTATDQAETFLMGLAREAGLDGLSGMRGHFTQNEVVFARPFLLQTRADLRGHLTRQGKSWVEDPTNANADYTRVKARRALGALAPLGITEERLAGTVHHLAMAQGVVRRATWDAARLVVIEVAGALRLDRKALHHLDPELQRRVLILCLLWLTGDDYPPRAPAIQRLQRSIFNQKDATLAGCRLRLREDHVVIAREPRALGGAVAPGQLWDGRWQVAGRFEAGQQVRALGHDGLVACTDWRRAGLPREVLIVTPALWRGGQLVAAPVLGIGADWSASVSQSFNQFILSH